MMLCVLCGGTRWLPVMTVGGYPKDVRACDSCDGQGVIGIHPERLIDPSFVHPMIPVG